MPSTVWSKSVLFPMPGSPPRRIRLPGTMPPPSTRLSSASCVSSRGSSEASICESGTGCGVSRCNPACCTTAAPREGEDGATVNSFIVFQLPHEGHLPTHFGVSYPHTSQT